MYNKDITDITNITNMTNYKKESIIIGSKDYDIFIGKNANGNTEIIKMCDKESLWFHFDDISSCHIILESKGDNIPKDYIRKIGNMLYLYKKNVPKYTRIIYTKVKNIKLTDDIGTVIPINYRYL